MHSIYTRLTDPPAPPALIVSFTGVIYLSSNYDEYCVIYLYPIS